MLAADCSGSVNREQQVAKQMTVLLVESSAGIAAVKAGVGRRSICEINLELVGAVKLAGAPKADDSIKGQIYNKSEARNHFPLGLESAPLLLPPPNPLTHILSLSLSRTINRATVDLHHNVGLLKKPCPAINTKLLAFQSQSMHVSNYLKQGPYGEADTFVAGQDGYLPIHSERTEQEVCEALCSSLPLAVANIVRSESCMAIRN